MTRSAIAVLTAAVTATSLALVPGAPVAHGADAGTGTGTSCAPTTRIIDAPADSLPWALGPAGHVVTRLWHSDHLKTIESVHAPDGTVTDITDGDLAPTGAEDVNGRGVVVGTEHYRAQTGVWLYRPWMFRHGRVRLLANPGKLGQGVRKDYLAIAVNGRSAVVGVKTNWVRFSPSDPEYVSRPVVWPTPGSTPIKLDLPSGFSIPSYSRLVDILADGTVTGVLIDREGRYHQALWVTPGADPDLRPLPDTWVPTALAGQWVMGRIGSPTDRVFLRSWTEAFAVDGPQPLHARGISSNGTFTVTVSDDAQPPPSYVGRPTRPMAQLGSEVRANDVVGTAGGQVLVHREGTSVEVITCALGLPEATDIAVTSVELPPTKVAP